MPKPCPLSTGFLPVKPPLPLTEFNPPSPNRNLSGAVGTYQRYDIGIGGPCGDFSPPAGYWCGTHTAGGGGLQYSGVPTGIIVGEHLAKVLPRFPYANNISGAMVQMFRPQAWASWMFEVGAANATTMFFEKGGFQGARGCGNHKGQTSGCGSQFYIENVFEELDAAREFFFDPETKTLYYHLPNATSRMPEQGQDEEQDEEHLLYEVPHLKQLITIKGTQKEPVVNVSILGIGMKDTAYTYMDPHEMVSGGDCECDDIRKLIFLLVHLCYHISFTAQRTE